MFSVLRILPNPTEAVNVSYKVLNQLWKKMYEASKDLDLNLTNFLMAHRNTPHSVTNQPPAVMTYGRTLRSKLHRFRPSDQMEAERLNVDNEQKVVDRRRNERTFEENQKIWVRTDNR